MSEMSNKEIVSLEDVVKSDSSIEKRVYFVRWRERSRASIKGRLFKGSIGLRGGTMVYFVQGEDCRERSPTYALE